MIQFPERPATDLPPSLDGDGAWRGMDMREDPGKLDAGWLAYAENARIDGGDARNGKGALSLQMGHAFAGTYTEEGEPVPPFPAWSAAASYALVSDVVHAGRAWHAQWGAGVGEEPGVSAKWAPKENLWGMWWKLDGPIWGAALYDDPNGDARWILVEGTRLRVCRRWTEPTYVALPEGLSVSGPVQVVQAFTRVLVVPADASPTMMWDGESAAMTRLDAEPPVPVDPDDLSLGYAAIALPNGRRAFYHADRLHVLSERSVVSISGIASRVYDPDLFEEKLNFGQDDRLVTGYPFDRETVLVFGERAIYGATGATGNYAGLRVFPVSRSVGTVAPASVAGWGGFCAFLHTSGVWTVDQANETRAVPSDFPISQAIEPIMERLNWLAAGTSCAAVLGARYYLAVPLEGAAYPGHILVYNTERQVWETILHIPGAQIIQLFRGPWAGRERIFAVDRRGLLLLLDEGPVWQLGDDATPVRTELLTRGYNGMGMLRVRALRMIINTATQGATVDLSTRTPAVGNERAVVTGRTRDRTRNRYVNRGRYDPANPATAHAVPGREDYAVQTGDTVDLAAGVRLDLEQDFEDVVPAPNGGRALQLRVVSTGGRFALKGVRLERVDGEKDSLGKV